MADYSWATKLIDPISRAIINWLLSLKYNKVRIEYDNQRFDENGINFFFDLFVINNTDNYLAIRKIYALQPKSFCSKIKKPLTRPLHILSGIKPNNSPNSRVEYVYSPFKKSNVLNAILYPISHPSSKRINDHSYDDRSSLKFSKYNNLFMANCSPKKVKQYDSIEIIVEYSITDSKKSNKILRISRWISIM